jgi:prolyl-tRNA synthetase
LAKDYRVSIDDSNNTPGEKYHHWELFGVPVRIEVGAKEISGNFVTICRRDTLSKEKVSDKEISKKVEKLSEEILANLKKKATEFLNSNIKSPKNTHDFLRDMEVGTLVRVAFCGREECAKEIQNKTNGGKVRGTIFGKNEKALGKCIYCNHAAKEIVYIARQY